MELTGKVAVVTGPGRGLGLAYAQELARRGAGITGQAAGQATGMGGDRLALWTHPVGTVVEFEPES